MAITKLWGEGKFTFTLTATQLTAPGASLALECAGAHNHSIALTTAATDTSVLLHVEGSVDGTLFGVLGLKNTPVTGLAIATNIMTITTDDTFIIQVENTPLEKIRINFTSEVGGTAATLDAKFLSMN